MGMTAVRKFAARWWRGTATSAWLAGVSLALVLAPGAHAEQARDWELGMQPAASPVREHIDALHDELLVIITLITLLVVGLLIYVIIRFNAKRHPVPTPISHNSVIEVIWTIVPVLILVFIAVPSFKLIFYEGDVVHPAMTIKVTGHQWYWTYEYPTQGDFSFDSNILSAAKDAAAGDPRLLGVDNPVYVPVNTVVRILVTSTDVIHSWYVPSMGVQEYAVPGRFNEAWLEVDRVGTYYGQCNQLCGLNHSFMPIEIKAVSKEDFQKWVAGAKKKFARNEVQPIAGQGLRLAAAQPR